MIRALLVATFLILVTIVGIPAQWISLKLGLPTQRHIPRWYHQICLWLMDVKVHVQGEPSSCRPLILIANHSSWLDHFVLSSVMPLVFIAKKEIASWPLFGLLAKLQRSVFVDRAKRQATRMVNQEIASRLKTGDPVVLYGEGTTGDGNRILPFRSALLGAVSHTVSEGEHAYLQPVSIAYTRLHGMPMGRQHRPVAAWYADTNLIGHVARVLRIGGIDAVVTYGTALEVKPNLDRKEVALILEQSVRRMTSAARLGQDKKMPIPNVLAPEPPTVPLDAETG
jgi:1-acyl-sn-glycerol-3-phosphate acyltransferase